jgi:hypothetical protein
MATKRESSNTNLASEFFVASQLFRLGYNVTITLGKTKEIDLVVMNENGKVITIDVKGLKNKTNWPIKPKLVSQNHFYVFVSYLNKFSTLQIEPEIFVVPSTRIKRLLGSWTGNPDVTALGYSKIKNSKYKNAWDLLFKK